MAALTMEKIVTLRTENSKIVLEFDLQMIQNDIDRRLSRINQGIDRAYNVEKVSILQKKKNRITQRLLALQS
ncbi:MAG: hypothetical protein AAGC96_08390 [Pseudomonadota bacterium]